MGLLSRMAGAIERRWGSSNLGPNGWPMSLGGDGVGGAVSTAEAENLAAYQACVSLISNAIAALPATLQIDGPAGREPAPPSAPWGLLNRPNRWQSWPAWAGMTAGQLLQHGNAVSWVRTDARGAVSALMPAPWPWLSPQIVAGGEGPRLVLDVTHTVGEAALMGLPARMLDTDVMHVRQRSDFGVIGRSTLSRSPAATSEGVQINRAAASSWSRSLRPSMVMSSPEYLNQTQRARTDERMEAYQGSINTGKVPLLEGGWKLEPISMTSLDAELLSSRAFSVATVCAAFGVPEVLLQLGARAIADPSPYVTTFYQQAVVPLIALIEAEFDHAVLPAGMHLAIDADGAMRGSFATMTAALCALLQSGAVTPNDVRAELDWPPHPDGNVLRVGSAPNYPADAPGMPHLAPSPGPTGTGLPEPGNHGNAGSKMNGAAGHA
jgi:HK97 family phage portal protein